MSDTSKWSDVLRRAVDEPGSILQAYSRFWNYSVGNQMLALFQCHGREIEPGPIGTYRHWQSVGRYVRKGEKAIELCMPVTCKRRQKAELSTADEPAEAFTFFVFKRNWFVLSQTDGAEYVPEPVPDWDVTRALQELNISRVPFNMMNGNAQGFATVARREVAVSPVAELPHKTLFHELAHVLLEHTEDTSHDAKEVEAESVALLCLESLGLPGAEFCRGYIQSYLRGAGVIPERMAQRIFRTADQILRAGHPARETSDCAAESAVA